MEKFNNEEFRDFVLNRKVVGFFEKPVKLKSGRTSHWYVNWRTVTEDAYWTDVLTDYILAFTETTDLNPRCFYGVAEGATKIATVTNMKLARKASDYGPDSHTLPMGRGKQKKHGDPKDKYFLGYPRGRVIILEDVTTTGGSLLNAIADVKECGDAEIAGAIGLTNRMELTPIPNLDDTSTVDKFAKIYERATGNLYKSPRSVEQAVNDAGVLYFAMTNARQLLQPAFDMMKPGLKIAEAINQEFEIFRACKPERRIMVVNVSV